MQRILALDLALEHADWAHALFAGLGIGIGFGIGFGVGWGLLLGM